MSAADDRQRIVALLRGRGWIEGSDLAALLRSEMGLSRGQGLGDVRKLVSDELLAQRSSPTRTNTWGGPAHQYSADHATNGQHGNETARSADTTPHGGETSVPEGHAWLHVWHRPTDEDPELHVYELRTWGGTVKGPADSVPALLSELQGLLDESPAPDLAARDAAAVVKVAQLAAHLGLTVDALLALKRHEIVRRCHDAYEATVAAQEASEGCTGIAAGWCPIHGTCTCVDPDDRNDDDCPLHSAESDHAPWVDDP